MREGKIFIAIFLFIVAVNGEKFKFDNYTVYKIFPQNIEQVKLLEDLQNDVRFDFWSDPVPSAEFVQVMASPKDKSYLLSFLDSNNMRAEVSMNNVQEHIEKQTVKKYTRSNIRSMTWDAYYTQDDINAWLDDLAITYPSIVSEIVGGVSYEGRKIKGVKISHGSGRRIIFLEGGIHSREWISPSAVCFIINELLTSNDPETVAAAHDFDWYIFPVTNPDGYIWTHDSFRMWRKNRRPIGSSFGVDLNRNWNNNWLAAGASSNPASDLYAGPGPFSEPETRSLSSYIRSIGDRIDLYLSFHSFGQMLLLPFGNTTEHLDNYYDAKLNYDHKELRRTLDWCVDKKPTGEGHSDASDSVINNYVKEQYRDRTWTGSDITMTAAEYYYINVNIGRRAMGALSVRYETQYVTGNIAEVIYLASGGSVDWVKGHLRVPLVYCYELRDRGQSGFVLPADQILPSNLETMDSVLDIIHQAKRFGYMNSSVGLTGSVVVLFGILKAYFL